MAMECWLSRSKRSLATDTIARLDTKFQSAWNCNRPLCPASIPRNCSGEIRSPICTRLGIDGLHHGDQFRVALSREQPIADGVEERAPVICRGMQTHSQNVEFPEFVRPSILAARVLAATGLLCFHDI